MGWHKQGDPVLAGSYYTSHRQDPESLGSSAHDGGIDIFKLADEDLDAPAAPDNRIVQSFTEIHSFTRRDGTEFIPGDDWVKETVRNLRFEKQKIHTRRKLSIVPDPPSEDELLEDLKGYNGKWRRAKAAVAWPLHVECKENEKRQKAELEERKIQKKSKEEERMREKIRMVKQAREMEEERKRIAEERRKKKADLEEEERQKIRAAEEERLRKANEKKPCVTCNGSGTCAECDGKGFFVSMYLTASVTAKCDEFHGRVARGCVDCGGRSEYTATGKLKKGNGKCSNCSGTGKVAPNSLDTLKDKQSFFQAGRAGWTTGNVSMHTSQAKKQSNAN